VYACVYAPSVAVDDITKRLGAGTARTPPLRERVRALTRVRVSIDASRIISSGSSVSTASARLLALVYAVYGGLLKKLFLYWNVKRLPSSWGNSFFFCFLGLVEV